MIPSLQDKKLLQSIGPDDLEAFLRSHNWNLAENIGDRATVWTKPSGVEEDYEVVVPLRRSTSEYARRVAEVIETLTVSERQDADQLVHDIIATNSDIVRVRLKHSAIDQGSIPLDYGVTMMTETRNALLAAACVTISPSSRYQTRTPRRATEFINGLKMRTEEGSFVVQIQSEVSSETQSPSRTKSDTATTDLEPFQRRALLCLAESLHALDQAVAIAQMAHDNAPFKNGIPTGVSANLCEAIAGMSIDASADEVSFQFNWSPTIPVADSIPSAVNFDRNSFPLLLEAAKVLRESTPRKAVELIGNIVGHTEETGRTGHITIGTYFDEEIHNVRMRLQDEAYQVALKIIGEQGFIVAKGDLVRQNRVYRLENVLEVSELEPPGPDENEGEGTIEYPMGSSEPAMVREDKNPFVDD